MIAGADIGKIIGKYDQSKIAIGTLGSHSSLNIFKGAKEEGFRTVCICKEKDAIMYKKYPLVDELIIVKDFTELLSEKMQERLRKLNVVLIPHGSFTAYLSTAELTDKLMVPMFGNRQLLNWRQIAKVKRNGCVKLGFYCLQHSKPLKISPLPNCRVQKVAEATSSKLAQELL